MKHEANINRVEEFLIENEGKGWSPEEIMEATGVSISAVRNICKKSKKIGHIYAERKFELMRKKTRFFPKAHYYWLKEVSSNI